MQLGQEATEALAETWSSLAGVCSDLSDAQWETATECPGWSVKDQLSHLIGIERALGGDAAPAWEGPLGEHVKNDFAVSNEPWIAVRRRATGPVVLAEFEEVTAGRLGALRRLGADEWSRVGWSPVGPVPQAEFMRVRVFDSWVHEQDVRQALAQPGGSGGLASGLALGRVQGAMPFVVGKKAAAPEGTVVRFDVHGPGADARTFDVGVEGGRAAVVHGRPPSVTLTMSSVDFTRLGCGRAGADRLVAEGRLGVRGDAALGEAVLRVINFMF